MRVAFYAPLKSPAHGTPSGDRRVAALLMAALGRAGHAVELASEFRSLDLAGDPRRQAELRAAGVEIARGLARRWRSGDGAAPDLWFTYHLYYKAPDWLGPEVSSALRIPYVIAEASYAPKRAGGPWALGHDAAGAAIRRADLVLASTRHDLQCLRPLVAADDRLQLFPPFLDAEPYASASRSRAAYRAQLATAHALDASLPWIVVAAMMRPGDKLASYRELAAALALVVDRPWQLLVAGDGPARGPVAEALNRALPGRVRYLGELAGEALCGMYAAGDLFVWPAVNEAYGMAMLEAQASGLPVVSCALRGVPDVVCDGRTGLLAAPGDPAALAANVRRLLDDAGERAAMGRAALAWVGGERNLDHAARVLHAALQRLLTRAGCA